jgi:hypothetical protein
MAAPPSPPGPDAPAKAAAPPSTSSAPAEAGTVSWHLQVVELGTSAGSDQSLTVYTPFFVVPDAAVIPTPAPVAEPPPVLTDAQIRSVVTIKGDEAEGTGFLVQTPDGPFVATHFHLLAANPHLQVLTSTGATITTSSIKGAVDRDLVMLAVQDDHYSYLPLADADSSPAAGDVVIIPDLDALAPASTTIATPSKSTSPSPPPPPPAPPTGKVAKIVGISPDRIDFDHSLGASDAGSPLIQVKSQKVLGILTSVKRIDLTDSVVKAWPATPGTGSAGSYGLPFNGVPKWENYDPAKLLAETQFLAAFHRTTRLLDSYLNGRHHRHFDIGNSLAPDNNYFLASPQLRKSQDAYRQFGFGADRSQMNEAARELLADLETFADTDIATLQDTSGFYVFDQASAREELAYRQALKKQLDNLANNLGLINVIAHSH